MLVSSLEVSKFGSVHIVCDDEKLRSLEVCILCDMMISLELRKFGSLRAMCDDDKFGSSKVRKFTQCAQ